MKLFITGASGFIGGSVAMRFMREGHIIRGLVRTQEQAHRLQALGITPVVGSLADTCLLGEEAKLADAVVNAASSDDVLSVETLLEALAGSGKAFLHTSGSSVIGDDACGEWVSQQVFAEDTPYTPSPEKAPRAALDQLILNAAQRNVRSIILCNTMIYGEGFGLKRDSVQIPPLVKQARQSGVARYVGKGLNVWSNVHIADVVELYLLALNKAVPGSFYFVENGQSSYVEIVSAIAQRLELGPAQPWPIQSAIDAWGYSHAVYSFGSNSRVTAARARKELGWQPKHNSVLDWIKHEMCLN